MSDTAPIAATLVEAESTHGSGDPDDAEAAVGLDGGERIGDYKVLGELGHGGMSVVYAATHVTSGERVALKLVRTPSAMNLSALRREIHGLSRIDHPGVVPVVATGLHRGRPWFAMPLLEGPTLRIRLRELWASGPTHAHGPNWEAQTDASGDEQTNLPPPSRGGAADQVTGQDPLGADGTPGISSTSASLARAELPPAPHARPPAAGGHLQTVLTIFQRLCETLAVIHARGVVHRDLKPENVILTQGKDDSASALGEADAPQLTPTIVDFGLMTSFGAVQGRESLEGEFALAGTPGYMAPEQILQELVDARADLYALGCMLYEALAQRRPFGDARGLDLVQRQLYETPDAPSVWVRGIAPELDALVLRLVARHPQARVGHAADAAEVIRRLLGRPASQGPHAAGHYLYRPTLAGRLDTLAELEGMLSRAEDLRSRATSSTGVDALSGPSRPDSPPALALVTGRSGIGKTRLAVELMASAARRRVKVYQGACLPLGATDSESRGRLQGAPLHPFRPFLRSVADHCARHGPRATAAYLGGSLPVLIPYAPEFANVPGAGDQGEVTGLSGEAAQRRVMQALLDVMNAYAADEPFLLVLDDVQWADPLTLNLLSALGNRDLELRGALLVCTGRSESSRPEFLALRKLPELREFELTPLNTEAVASIVEDMLASESVPRAFTDYLARASEGNPYFVAEYLRSAVDDRLLHRQITGEWVVDAKVDTSDSGRLAALPLPESVEMLVLRRVRQLSKAARGVLDAAAVLGVEVDSELIAAMQGCPPDAVLDPLAELMAHAVLRSESSGGLSFSHQKVRELTYGEMEPQRRKQLHAAAAHALEPRVHGADGSEDPALLPVLANHWYAAGDNERAFDALVHAGRAALAAYAPASAAGPFEKALGLLTAGADRPALSIEPIVRARLHRDFAWARYCNGDVADFLDHSHRALEELGEGTPTSKPGWVWTATTQLARHAGVTVVPASWLVAKVAKRRARYELAAETASALSWGYIYGNSPPRALGLSLIAANLSARAGSTGPRAIPYTMLGATLGSFGMERAADRYFAIARQSAPQVREIGQAFVQRWIEGMHHFNFARWARGERLVRAVLERGRATGDAHAIVNSLSILSIEAYHRGQLRMSAEFADQARELARANHYSVLETVGRCQLAAVHIHRGANERALALLADREDGDIESEGVMTLISRRSIQAGAHLRAGQLGAAVEAAEAAVALLQANPAGNMTSIMAHYWLCAVYLAQFEALRSAGKPVAKALTRARLTQKWADRFARMYPIGQPIALRHAASMRSSLGDPKAGARIRERGAIKARELGMFEELRLAHLGAGVPG